MNNNINFLKKKQRVLSLKKRSILKKTLNLDNLFFYQILNQYEWFKKSKVIASFLSINSEIPTNAINKYIQSSKKILCLPLVKVNNNEILIFKSYSEGDILVTGKFGVSEPLHTKIYLPDILLIPCLAFDEYGFRLGYGGGYYDKTISFLNSINHNFITIGLTYDDQKVDNVAHNHLDQKLNYILTEKQLYKIL